MKKIILFLIVIMAMASTANAETVSNYWKLSGTAPNNVLSPLKSTWSLNVAGGITFGASTMAGALNMADYNINNVGTLYVDADNNSGVGSAGNNDISFYNNGTRYVGFNGNTMQFFGGAPTITTTSNTNFSITPNGSGQTKIGDAGTCISLATDNDDLCATDDVEVMDNLYTGGITMATNRGDVPWIDWSVTNASADGTAQSLPILIDGQFIASFYAESDGAGSVDTKEVRTVKIRNYGDLITAQLTLPGATSLPATCTQNQIATDTDSDDCANTGGGDGALCICKTTNTWALLVNY